MNDVLLTVSGTIEPQIEEKTTRGERPHADYMAMARSFPADLIDYPIARKNTGWFGCLLEKVGGPNLMLAWACFKLRQSYKVIFTDGEQVGLPLALLLQFAFSGPLLRHCMIVHRLSVWKKMIFLDVAGVHNHIDRFFCYATWQAEFIRRRWKLPECRVLFTPFMVDDCFFTPGRLPNWEELPPEIDRTKPVICSVGLEYRDYPTLIEAVRGLQVQVVLAAASPWSKRRDTSAGRELPDNVLVHRFSQYKLRTLYAASQFVVMPLYPVDFQAGVTAILEAMAMGKAVICTRTPGQTDVIEDGVTGMYVEPGNPGALRSAIEWLLEHPKEVERMGCNGRKRIEQEMSLERYVLRLREQVDQVLRDEK